MAKLKKTLPKEFVDMCFQLRHPWSVEDIEKCKNLLSGCEPDARQRGYYNEVALRNENIPVEIVEWLFERGADVNAPYKYGTPLYGHAGRGNLEICRFLITHGADVEAEDDANKTPLYAAADRGHLEIVKLLLENGADPNHHCSRAEECVTPLLYMLRRMNPGEERKSDVAEILVKAQGGKENISAEEWKKAQEYIRDAGEKFEFEKSGWTEEYRQLGETKMRKLYNLFEVEPPVPIIKHNGVSPITVDSSLTIAETHDALWEYLVPPSGRCDTVQGEVIRISGRIGDEVYRNGGINWDSEYRKMLTALVEYFCQGRSLENADLEIIQKVSKRINKCKACGCEEDVGILKAMAVKWVSLNSNPIPLGGVNYNR